MDEKLKDAYDFANYSLTLDRQKHLAKQNFTDNSVYYFNGGKFTATLDLMTSCWVLVASGEQNVVLLDDNQIPVKVDDLQAFMNEVIDKYTQSATTYYNEYQRIIKNRTVEGLVDE